MPWEAGVQSDVRRIVLLQADTNARFDQMFNRMDHMQAEHNRRFDALSETIMTFDRRVSRNEVQIEVIREQLQAVATRRRESSVRTHVKRIRAKLGISRQANLVWLVLSASQFANSLSSNHS